MVIFNKPFLHTQKYSSPLFYNIPLFILPINPVSGVNGIGILRTNSCILNFFSKSFISDTNISGR
jgi:hypothetical protein